MALDVANDDELAFGTEIVGFDYIVPADDDTCRQHIADSALRGLPEAVGRKSLRVIANGPSARYAPLEGDTLALNGSIDLFTRHGLAPTYWAACDPQALVADFLPDNPPEATTYLVASKCHPSVFEKLAGRDVRLWRLRDHAAEGKLRQALCCSVTLSAIWLMRAMGYTDFDIWGWDACYLDGAHHAGPGEVGERQPLHVNYGGQIVGEGAAAVVVGGRTFETTRTWAAEADAAVQFFQLAEYFDLGVTVHGDGMIRAAQQSIEGA